MRIGFDNELYVRKQTEHIKKRIDRFEGKLYLEFGGKLFDDFHASRVLPGFDVNGKIKLLLEMKEIAEVIMCISAGAIEKNKVRSDIGITYDMDVIRLTGEMASLGIHINSVVITQYEDQPSAAIFKKKLENMGVRAYVHRLTKGYPTDVDTIISPEGYGANEYIETGRPLVVVTAPGPASGKLATCLSQLYHESIRGKKAGYAKFETFPIWNIPLKHPVNLAYEAATADLKDVNMIDPYHLDAYGETTVNYNRDIEVFPVVASILKKILGRDVYKSPTDMGVNMAGYAICDDEVCREAAGQEIVRRYLDSLCEVKQGTAEKDVSERIGVLMRQLDLGPESRAVLVRAREAAMENRPAAAIGLPSGVQISGKMSDLMTAPAAALINAVKNIAGLADPVYLLSPVVLEPIIRMKKELFKLNSCRLNVEEVLIAMSICAATNPIVELAVSKLGELSGCEAHSTVMPLQSDADSYRRLGIRLTSDPEYAGKLF